MSQIGQIGSLAGKALKKIGDTTLDIYKKAGSLAPKIGDIHGGSGKSIGDIGHLGAGMGGALKGMGAGAHKAGGGGVAPAAGGKRTIRQGSSGQDVARCQNLLNMKLAYHPPPLWVDGIFGPKTDKNVREFQGKCGLAVDGVVGPQTWGMLES